MSGSARSLRRLFGSTEGLLLVVTAWEAVTIAFLSIFSGPAASFGLPQRLGLILDPALRVRRIILLYHALAVPFVAALVYLILDLLSLDERYARLIRPTITIGYMLTSTGGLSFGYFDAGWIAHGLYLVGLSLGFYAGVMLCVALFPWRRGTTEESFSPERLAFWLMALYTLVSAAIGGAAGAYFGNGFSALLAEDVIRQSHNLGQRAIISHLHIMLTLIDVAILLIVARTFELRGRLQRVTMWLIIVGSTIVSLATWSVMVVEEIAHKIINVGAAFLLPGALIVAVCGFVHLARGRAATSESGQGGRRRLQALLRDPIRFGILFELVFVNIVVTVPGVYVAFNLETYRQPAFLEVERAIAVGHWHVLATLSAVMVFFLVINRWGVRGWLRQTVGWSVLLGSTLAFVFVQFYLFRQPEQDTSWTAAFFETGVAMMLVSIAMLLGTMLIRALRTEA